MTGYKKINMETWARREHYEYYTKQLKVEYNITANVDVKMYWILSFKVTNFTLL